MSLETIKNKYNYRQHTEIDIDTVCNFPLCIFDLSYKIDADKLVNEIYAFKERYPSSMSEYNKDYTNVRSWHSDYATHKMTNILDDLIEVQKEKIKKFSYRSCRDGCIINTFNIWINIYSTNDFTARHKHNDYCVSTVYYPFVEDDPTPIIFDNNNFSNFKEYKIIPKKNMLIVFHSSLYHRVPKTKESCRISISSNSSLERTSNIDPFIFQQIGK